jgi:hypothetical protein
MSGTPEYIKKEQERIENSENSFKIDTAHTVLEKKSASTYNVLNDRDNIFEGVKEVEYIGGELLHIRSKLIFGYKLPGSSVKTEKEVFLLARSETNDLYNSPYISVTKLKTGGRRKRKTKKTRRNRRRSSRRRN